MKRKESKDRCVKDRLSTLSSSVSIPRGSTSLTLIAPERSGGKLQPAGASGGAQAVRVLDDFAVQRPPPMLEELLADLPVLVVEAVFAVQPEALGLVVDVHDEVDDCEWVARRRRPHLDGLREDADQLRARGGPREEVEDGVVRDVLLCRCWLELRRKRWRRFGPQYVREERIPHVLPDFEHVCNCGSGSHYFH